MMTRSGMEVVSPSSSSIKNLMMNSNRSGKWTQQENKMFENALAHIDSKTPDRWERVAAMLPGKTVPDVILHYRDLEDDVSHIEAGLVPFPGYISSSFTLDWERESGFDGMKLFVGAGAAGGAGGGGGKRSGGGGGGGRLSDQERKKGVPWSEQEHKLFLMGLKKYGKGDWRNISRNFVVTRTPTQVASHAQKYYIRLNSGGKDKRRASIHDITTINLPDNGPPSPSQPSGLTMQSTSGVTPGRSDQFSMVVDSEHHSEAASGFSPLKHANLFRQLPYGIDPYGIKLEAQISHRGTLHDSMVVHRAMLI